MRTEPAAVVFDCDGTLIDSEPLTRRCIEVVLARMGLVLTDAHFEAMVGRAWPESSRVLRDRVGVTDLDTYLVDLRREFEGRYDEVASFPDAVAIVRSLVASGVPVAVCTSSGRMHLDRVLASPDFADIAFDAEVTREDTDRHKPDPAPYLLAAARLGVAAERCVAVEDSPTGARSALAAGMRVVVVDHGQHPAGSFDDLDVVINRQLSLADVMS